MYEGHARFVQRSDHEDQARSEYAPFDATSTEAPRVASIYEATKATIQGTRALRST